MRQKLLMIAGAMALLLPLCTVGAETITREKILAKDKEWQDNYDQFKPDQDLLDVLNSQVASNTRIDVYLGLWCSDSRKHVPTFIKIMDSLKVPVAVNYYEVPRKSGAEQKYYVEELKVERVPTFIIYRDDKEIGRIVENPQTTMLDDLIQLM